MCLHGINRNKFTFLFQKCLKEKNKFLYCWHKSELTKFNPSHLKQQNFIICNFILGVRSVTSFFIVTNSVGLCAYCACCFSFLLSLPPFLSFYKLGLLASSIPELTSETQSFKHFLEVNGWGIGPLQELYMQKKRHPPLKNLWMYSPD
jgi:hypothetical protein